MIGPWLRTPWLLRALGKPEWRRLHTIGGVGGIFTDWEYASSLALSEQDETGRGT